MKAVPEMPSATRAMHLGANFTDELIIFLVTHRSRQHIPKGRPPFAGVIVASNRGTPFALVGDRFAVPAEVLGTLAFVVTVGGLYAWMRRLARGIPEA